LHLRVSRSKRLIRESALAHRAGGDLGDHHRGVLPVDDSADFFGKFESEVRPSARRELARAPDALSSLRAGGSLWLLRELEAQVDQHRPVRPRSKREGALS